MPFPGGGGGGCGGGPSAVVGGAAKTEVGAISKARRINAGKNLGMFIESWGFFEVITTIKALPRFPPVETYSRKTPEFAAGLGPYYSGPAGTSGTS